MAYLSSEKTKQIREAIKKAFPAQGGWKFSIRNDNHSSLTVNILQGPVRFSEKEYVQINQYYPNQYSNADVLQKLISICNSGNHDRSDTMTDYFDVGWYVSIRQGEWDKPYSCKAKNYNSPAIAPTPTTTTHAAIIVG